MENTGLEVVVTLEYFRKTTKTSSMWVLYTWETTCRKLWLFGTQEANGLLFQVRIVTLAAGQIPTIHRNPQRSREYRIQQISNCMVQPLSVGLKHLTQCVYLMMQAYVSSRFVGL